MLNFGREIGAMDHHGGDHKELSGPLTNTRFFLRPS